MNYTLNRKYRFIDWDTIDTVVFDIGNVLLRFDPPKLVSEIFPDDPSMQQRILTDCIKTPYWISLDHGTLTTEEAIDGMAGDDKEFADGIRLFMSVWSDYKTPIIQGIKALQICKAHGKKLYVMSNYHQKAFDQICKKHSFFSLFDDFVVSSHDKLLKPQAPIYNLLTDRFHCIPDRTLFIDDTPLNIETALCLGWQGICYNKPGMLSAFFGFEL